MRIVSLVVSFVLTVTLATAALAYVTERVGQHRIVVYDGWLSSSDTAPTSEPKAYRAYGQLASTGADSVAVVADQDTAGRR